MIAGEDGVDYQRYSPIIALNRLICILMVSNMF